MYELPSREDVKKCIITEEVILKKQAPILITAEGQSDPK